MKKIVTLVSLMILILSCSRNENSLLPVDLGQNNIVGNWQLTAAYISPGGETEWQSVENGPVYSFEADQVFMISEGDCQSGSYKLEENILELQCGENADMRKFRMLKLTSYEMEMSFVGCIEACIYRFQKQ